LRDVLATKGIPAIVDEWGADVHHDWPWWRKMLPHYLDRLGV
jgi:esterase/lipase superfamily enzyme